MEKPILIIVPFADLDRAAELDRASDLDRAAQLPEIDRFLQELANKAAAALALTGIVKAKRDWPAPPAGSLDRRRGQFDATGFISVLAELRRKESNAGAPTGTGGVDSLLLGVTSLDLFIPRLNFVFGVADAGAAVISLRRLAPEYYSRTPDRSRLMQRAVKEAIHELGHVLGLSHCEDADCIMRFSRSIEDTDRKGPGFCGNCAGALDRANRDKP